MAVRRRKKAKSRRRSPTPKSRRKKTTKRASTAARGVTVSMTVAELKKFIAANKKKTRRGGPSRRRRSPSLEDILGRMFRGGAVSDAPKTTKSRPSGTDISSSSCLTCGSMMYEKDEGPYTHYYCPKCDKWTKAIRLGG